MLNKLHKFGALKACCSILLLFLLNLYALPLYAQAQGLPPAPGDSMPPPPPPTQPPAAPPPSSPPTAQDMIVNISTQLPNLMRMVTAFAYIAGIYFIVSGLFKLKQYGESRTQMSYDRDLKGPLVFLIVGALLIYLPSTVRIGLSTFWANPNPYAYIQEQGQWAELMNVILLIVQFIGVIAFIRGLILMSHLGTRGGQPGGFNKAMAHVIGGILCINIYQFVQVIMVTLGIQT